MLLKTNHNIRAAIYARVSSEQQAKSGTIESQIAALKERVKQDGLTVESDLCFIDDGFSGATLVRPGLERLRDQAALGTFDRVYIFNPFRLARKYAYQVLLIDELQRCGVEIVFLNHNFDGNPEENLLLQVQGMIAEYERAKILERSRRGKLHKARKGSISVLGIAPYGYRYINVNEGDGRASFEIILEEAKVVQQIFEWVALDGHSLGSVCKCLQKIGILTRTGKKHWNRSTLWGMLKNPAYKGMAAYGRTHIGDMRPRLRPMRGSQEHPRRAYSIYNVPSEEWISIPVPSIVSEELFDAVQEKLIENKKRNRQRKCGACYLLQGLLICDKCGYSFYGKLVCNAAIKGKKRCYVYYRCPGSDAHRFDGQRICSNKQIRSEMLEQAVWEDVCLILSNPDRIEKEYKRRLTAQKKDVKWGSMEQLRSVINKVKRGISRLIDSYEDGLLEKEEFEPRIRRLRERLKKLEKELNEQLDEEKQMNALQQVIGQMKDFADKVTNGLQQIDWITKRDIIRAMVKEIRIGDEEIQIVYKVNPQPILNGSRNDFLQHCWRRKYF